ncbi:MAG: alpha/beta hydrolase [Eubacterium sp.]
MDVFMPVLKLVWEKTRLVDARRMKREKYPEGIKEYRDIPYLDDGDMYHLLDIYMPADAGTSLPVMIDIHGGGWMYGTKEINRCYCHRLAAQGFIVASINYRLAGKVLFREQITDIFSAFGWIGENLESYGADMKNVFLTGDSAGGHFACVCAALTKSESLRKEFGIHNNPLQFNAVGATSPVVDLLSPNIILNVNLRMLLGSNLRKSPFYKYMKFDNIALPYMPPFYILTSSGDFVHSQSHKLKKVLDNLGVPNQLRDWKCRYKGKRLPHCFAVLDSASRPAEIVIREMADFFKKYINKPI